MSESSAVEAAVIGLLKAQKVKLWLAPFVGAGGEEAVAALAAAYAAKLKEEDAGVVFTVLKAAQQRALGKLRAKRAITVSVAGAEVTLDSGTSGAEARRLLAGAAGHAGPVRVVACGRGLVDHETLEAQGWPSDAARGGNRPLRALVVACAPQREEESSSSSRGGDVRYRTEEVATLARASKRVARDVELADLHGRQDAQVHGDEGVRENVVLGLALHGRGRSLLDSSGGDAVTCARAIHFLVDADEAFGRVPSAITEKLENVALLQLDLCRAYAFVEDPTALADAEQRLARAEVALSKRLDPRYVQAALQAVTSRPRVVVPPNLIPLCRLKLLQGVLRAATTSTYDNALLQEARALLRALTVEPSLLEPLQMLGASRCEAVAAVRRAEGDVDVAAAYYVEARAPPPALWKRPKKAAPVSAQALDQLRSLAPHTDLAAVATALRRSNNDVNRAFDRLSSSSNEGAPPGGGAGADHDNNNDDDDDDDDEAGYQEARALLQRELAVENAATVEGCDLDLEELLLARWSS